MAVPAVELGDAVALIHIRLRVEDLVAVDAPRQAVVVGAREGEEREPAC